MGMVVGRLRALAAVTTVRPGRGGGGSRQREVRVPVADS
jgi:hypothetical protein